eukprot:3747481-Rhodomonas_salina.1
MSGTCYADAMRCPVLSSAMLVPGHRGMRYAVAPSEEGRSLRERYAMSGINIAYAATGLGSVELLTWSMVLAVCGTDVGRLVGLDGE